MTGSGIRGVARIEGPNHSSGNFQVPNSGNLRSRAAGVPAGLTAFTVGVEAPADGRTEGPADAPGGGAGPVDATAAADGADRAPEKIEDADAAEVIWPTAVGFAADAPTDGPADGPVDEPADEPAAAGGFSRWRIVWNHV